MNLFTSIMHLVGSSAAAYYTARHLRDPLTRPNILAGFQLAESGSVPFLEALKDRAATEGDRWLVEKLERHAADERRHGQIFAQALKQLGKEAIDPKQAPEHTDQDGKPDKRQRSPFFEGFFEGYSPEDLKPERIDWMVFLGSTYILELDASKDFARMAKVLPEDDLYSRNLKKGIASVAQDETRHAAYLYEALHRRLSPAEVQAVIDNWRTRKVNALLAMVGNMVNRGGESRSLVKDGAPTETSPQPELATV